MTRIAFCVCVATLAAGPALAGGIDRTRTPYMALFESGTYLEFGIANVSPSVSGEYPGFVGGGSTGDMAPAYTNFSFIYKQDIDEKLAFAVFVNTPYGADASYHQGFYDGLRANWGSEQLVVMLRYRLDDAFSIYGGARYVSSVADIDIPDQMIRAGLAAAGNPVAGIAPAGSLAYKAKGDRSGTVGFVLGGAYERPDIALRIGLTYESQLDQNFKTSESIPFLTSVGAPLPRTTTKVELPQTVTLDFQTGIAPETLLFGSVRWSEWSQWEVRPQGFDDLTGEAITGFEDDVLTWQLGVGRRLNEEFSVFARATYEDDTGEVSSRLSPYDGQLGIALGGTWTRNNMRVTAGLEYAWLGDTFDATGTQFKNNTAFGLGLAVGYTF